MKETSVGLSLYLSIKSVAIRVFEKWVLCGNFCNILLQGLVTHSYHCPEVKEALRYQALTSFIIIYFVELLPLANSTYSEYAFLFFPLILDHGIQPLHFKYDEEKMLLTIRKPDVNMATDFSIEIK